MMERQELQAIRSKALEESNCPELNPQWKRAYEALADAADRLDAMQARSEVPSYMQGRPLEIGTECGWAPVPECPLIVVGKE